jgi:hypothetical protein
MLALKREGWRKVRGGRNRGRDDDVGDDDDDGEIVFFDM